METTLVEKVNRDYEICVFTERLPPAKAASAALSPFNCRATLSRSTFNSAIRLGIGSFRGKILSLESVPNLWYRSDPKNDQPRFRINKWSEVFDTIKECAVFDVFLTGLLVRRDSICGRT